MHVYFIFFIALCLSSYNSGLYSFHSVVFFMTVCTARIDLGFLLETSSTAMRNGNRYYTRFLRKIVQVFTITKDTTRVGIVTYATRTYGNIAFTESYTRRLVYSAISRIRQLDRGRRLGKALTYARTYLFKGKPQCGRRRILVVLTAGGSTDKVRQAKEGLQKAGVEIFVVGVGGVSRRTLMQVATDRQQIFKIQFAQLHTIVNTLKERMCYSPGKYSFSLLLSLFHTIKHKSPAPLNKKKVSVKENEYFPKKTATPSKSKLVFVTQSSNFGDFT